MKPANLEEFLDNVGRQIAHLLESSDAASH